MAEFLDRKPLFKSQIADGPSETQLHQLDLIVDLTGAPADRAWLGTRCEGGRAVRAGVLTPTQRAG